MRFRYVHAIQGSLAAAVVFVIATVVIPTMGPSDSIELILTVSTFLFAILAGFYINRLNQRFDTIRELLGQEDAHWLTLFKGAAFFNEEFGKRLAELMDTYYIYALDAKNLEYYKRTTQIFCRIHDELARSKPQETRNITTYMIELLSMLEERRNRISMLVREKLTGGQWLMLLILAGIILYCLFFLKMPTMSSWIITPMLSTVLALVLLTMRDLQNFRLNGESLGIESAEETFDILGRPRYYNAAQLEDGSAILPENIEKYRLGRHTPGSTDLDIVLMVRENGSTAFTEHAHA